MPGDQHTYGFNRRDAEALISSIGSVEVETPERRRGGSSGAARFFLTPSGGISAGSTAATTFPFTSSTAACTAGMWSSTASNTIISAGFTAAVHNPFDQAVAGSVIITAQLIGGKWTVDAASCGS